MNWHKLTKGWGDFIFGYTIVAFTLMAEFWVLTHGLPTGVDAGIAGRILGTFDALALAVISWRYGSTRGSQEKNALLAMSTPPTPVGSGVTSVSSVTTVTEPKEYNVNS